MTDISRMDAEQAVLGCLLMDTGLIRVYAARLHPDLFYYHKHKDVCRAILALLKEKEIPEDIIPAIRGWLEDKAGWFLEDRITIFKNLMDAAVTAASIDYYLTVIEEKAMRRTAVRAARVLQDTAEDPKTSQEDVIRAAEAVHSSVMASQSGGDVTPDEFFDEVGDYFERMAVEGYQGITTGFYNLDRTLGGLHNGVYILAGRPGNGKTTFSINMAIRQCEKGISVGYISLEASRKEFFSRIMSYYLRGKPSVPPLGIPPEEWQRKITRVKDQNVRPLPLCLEADCGRTVDVVVKVAHSMKAKRGIQILYIDYAQLMTSNGGSSRVEQLDTISKKVVGLNKDLGIPVVAMAQLNRQIGQREIHRPVLTDIKGCGSFEEDATGVLFTCDPQQWGEVDADHEISIAKHREGPIAMGHDALKFTWQRGAYRFQEVDSDEPPPF